MIEINKIGRRKALGGELVPAWLPWQYPRYLQDRKKKKDFRLKTSRIQQPNILSLRLKVSHSPGQVGRQDGSDS